MRAFGPITVLDQSDLAIVDQLGDEITAFFAATDIHDGLEGFVAVRDEDGKLAAGNLWLDVGWYGVDRVPVSS